MSTLSGTTDDPHSSSSPSLLGTTASTELETVDIEDTDYLGLVELLPVRQGTYVLCRTDAKHPFTQEPELPTPIPYSYSIYSPPSHLHRDLELPDDRSRLILRLVGSHPLWGHHL